MMTVKDLIDLLARHPADLRVVVNGYEEGYDDLSPEQISVVRIALNTGVEHWVGRHSDTDDAPRDAARLPAVPDVPDVVDALVLRRESN